MNGRILAQFRMECRNEVASLFHENGIAIIARQDSRTPADATNNGRAYEDRL